MHKASKILGVISKSLLIVGCLVGIVLALSLSEIIGASIIAGTIAVGGVTGIVGYSLDKSDMKMRRKNVDFDLTKVFGDEKDIHKNEIQEEKYVDYLIKNEPQKQNQSKSKSTVDNTLKSIDTKVKETEDNLER